MKTILVILILLIAGLANAYHYHSWIKQNETHGTDAYGNSVVICSWKCTTDYNNPHYAQTQGFSFCPMP